MYSISIEMPNLSMLLGCNYMLRDLLVQEDGRQLKDKLSLTNLRYKIVDGE